MAVTCEDFRIDIAHEQSFKYLQAKQYDHNSRKRRLIITDSNVPITYSEDRKEYITLSMSKGDNNYANVSCPFEDDGYPYITFTEGMLSEEGDIECELRIYDSEEGSIITTFTFMMTVSKSLLNHDRLVNSEEFNILNTLILQAVTIPDLVDEVNESLTEINNSIEQVNSDIESYQNEYNTITSEIKSFQTEATEWYEQAQEAESARVTAEEERQSNENARVEAENTRNSTESERISAEQLRNEKETERQNAEATRISNENERIEAENNRETAEDLRESAENERQSNEKDRIQAESERDSAEDVRQSNENTRIENENERIAAELERASAENTRQSNENIRIANEETRQTQEAQRQEDTQEAILNCNTSAVAANDAVDRVNAALENLEFSLIDCDGGNALSNATEYENDFNGGNA